MKKPPPETRTCQRRTCRRPFTTRRKGQRFCAEACQQAAHVERRRERGYRPTSAPRPRPEPVAQPAPTALPQGRPGHYQCRDATGQILAEAVDMGDARDWHEAHPQSDSVTKGSVTLMTKPGGKVGAKMLADRYKQARSGGWWGI